MTPWIALAAATTRGLAVSALLAASGIAHAQTVRDDDHPITRLRALADRPALPASCKDGCQIGACAHGAGPADAPCQSLPGQACAGGSTRWASAMPDGPTTDPIPQFTPHPGLGRC